MRNPWWLMTQHAGHCFAYWRPGLVLMAMVSLFCPLVLAGEPPPPVVVTAQGPVQGSSDGAIAKFLGIPYAAPPVGNKRWQPPEEAAPWTAIRPSQAFGPACMQPHQMEGAQYNEDCLSLNIWTPSLEKKAHLPVMVWIHGGGFTYGSGSQAEYDGKHLAGHGVVVVTLNYRLGPLGFLAHPLLDQESTHQTSGNYGLLDQIAALRWVQRNIAFFGGDPGNVTLFGQSAGSRSVGLLLLSPLSSGLFHRAIAQSGGPLIGSEFLSPVFNGNKQTIAAMGQRLAHNLGCDTSTDELAAMRARPAAAIVAAAATQTDILEDSGLFFAPALDGYVLPDNALAALEQGHLHEVPLILGYTANEGTVYLAGKEPLTRQDYANYITSRFTQNRSQALTMFPVQTDQEVAPMLDSIVTIAANAYPARLVGQSRQGKKSQAYLYQFSRRPNTAKAQELGAFHGVDLAYVFGTLTKTEGYDTTDSQLSAAMMAYWTHFAKTGNPNGPGLPNWPAYTKQSERILNLGEQIQEIEHPYIKECNWLYRQATSR